MIRNQSRILILLFLIIFGFKIFLVYIYDKHGPEFIYIDTLKYKIPMVKLWNYWDSVSFSELFDYNKYAYDIIGDRNIGYYIVYALIYPKFGNLGMRILNSFFLCIAAYLIYLLAIEISNLEIAYYSYCLTLFYPSNFLYSVAILKEALVIFFIVLFLLCLTKLFKNLSISWILGSLISFICLFSFRFYMAVLILLAVEVILIWNFRRNFFTWIVVGSLTIFVFYYLPDIIKESISLSSAISWHKIKSMSVEWDFYRRINLPVALKALIFYFFQPLPWNFTSIWFVPVNLGSLVWYFMIPFFVVGLIESVKTKELRFIAISVLIVIIFHISIYITGTEFRHREQIFPLLVLISIIGYFKFKFMRFCNKILYISIPFVIISMLALYKLWALLL